MGHGKMTASEKVGLLAINKDTMHASGNTHGGSLVTALLAFTLLGGCLDAGVSECPWGLVCPAERVCHEYDPSRYKTAIQGRCVDPGQLKACQGKAEGESCTYNNLTQNLSCRDGICEERRCGDRVTDTDRGETCDQGDSKDNDGCTADCKKERFTWFQVQVDPDAPSPPPLAGAAMATNTTTTVYLAGGRTDKGSLDARTWAFNSETSGYPLSTSGSWTLVHGPSGPPARTEHAMACDPWSRRVVLHGGQSTEPLLDTWHYVSQSWKREADGPKKRFGHAMAWDETLGQLLVFGGASPDPPHRPYGDLWSYDVEYKVWTEIKGTHPTGRRDHVMIHDPVRRRALLTGGVTDHGVTGRDDCALKSKALKTCHFMTSWTFDGAAWSPMSGPQISPGRRSAAGAFDRAAGQAVVFGGAYTDAGGKTHVLDDLWISTADGKGWRQVKRAQSDAWPPARHEHAMVSLGEGAGVLIYGGKGKNGEILADAWFGLMYKSKLCGNGVLDPGEQCDGVDGVSGKTCKDLGYSGGTRSCVLCERWRYNCW